METEPSLRVLYICENGVNRSRAFASITPGARYAGVRGLNKEYIREWCDWAERIFVFEEYMLYFLPPGHDHKIFVLKLPDTMIYGSERVEQIELKEKMMWKQLKDMIFEEIDYLKGIIKENKEKYPEAPTRDFLEAIIGHNCKVSTLEEVCRVMKTIETKGSYKWKYVETM